MDLVDAPASAEGRRMSSNGRGDLLQSDLRNFYIAERKRRDRRRLVRRMAVLILISGVIATICLVRLFP
jgi:hypothetical protein